MIEEGIADVDDLIIMTFGTPMGESGGTNAMKIISVKKYNKSLCQNNDCFRPELGTESFCESLHRNNIWIVSTSNKSEVTYLDAIQY